MLHRPNPVALLAASLLALLATSTLAAGAPPQEPAAAPAAAQEPAGLEELRRALAEQQKSLEAQRQLLESMVAANPAHEPLLRFYGFIDAGVQKNVYGPRSLTQAVSPNTATTFALGDIDLYLDAQPLEHWSALLEVRLSNLPSGLDAFGFPGRPYQRTSTAIYDLNDPGGGLNVVRLSSIIIERAYVQYQHNDLFSLRAGAFLTPFGIWNIDHGQPTLIPLMLPGFELHEFFPTHQLGVELFGSLLRAPWEYGYFVYLTNGRTPGELSLSENKLVGGRLFARTTRPFHMTLGLSGFAGRYGETERDETSFDPPTFTTTETVAYHEQALGADVSIDLGNLRLRSEFAWRRVRYVPGERDQQWGPGLYTADHVEWDLYTLAAFRLPWLGLEPYGYLEAYRFPSPLGEGVAVFSGGLNVHFNPAVQLKLQYARRTFYEKLDSLQVGTSEGQGLDTFSARLVLAF